MPTFDLDPKPLDEKNRLKLGLEHARLELTRNAVKQEQRDANGGYKKQLKDLNKRGKEIAEQLDTGEYREKVEVDEKPLDSLLMVEIFRAGTKESLGKRDMTDEEKKAAKKRLQGSLFGDGEEGDTERPPPMNGKASKNGKAHASPAEITHRGQVLKNTKLKKGKSKTKGARS